MATAEPASSLHVYRIGGLLGDDKIVKAEDRSTSLYYLKGQRDDAQWQFALHAGGPDGALICRVHSAYTGPPLTPPGPIVIIMTSERRPFRMERRRGMPESVYWFRGPDDKEYHWQSQCHLWRNEMQCLDAQGEVVATYRVTTMAMSKDGELRVNPSGQFMIDLLVATSLAMRTPNH
ncbi:hypothetical protein HYDPIDRAFT_87932 [Hydnomerulius pinastri MD-312]|nr:hypothetical protein HYDPIDRAFT_87932 [Hydnomerulius pinastri MD-312]